MSKSEKFNSSEISDQNCFRVISWFKIKSMCRIWKGNFYNAWDFESILLHRSRFWEMNTTRQITNQKLYKLSVIKSKYSPCPKLYEEGFSNDFELNWIFYNVSVFESKNFYKVLDFKSRELQCDSFCNYIFTTVVALESKFYKVEEFVSAL